MLWSEFSPYVLSYVLGAPDPLITHHVRLAAIDFCRRTSCYQASLDPLQSNGTVLVEIESDTGLQLIKIKAVAVDGKDYPLVDAVGGLKLARSDSPQDFCFTQDNQILQVYPAPDSGVSVVIDAILAPTLTATGLSDLVARTYMGDIALGAIASLQRVPEQPYTDLNSSAIMQAQYQSRVSATAAKVARGLMGGKMRANTTFL